MTVESLHSDLEGKQRLLCEDTGKLSYDKRCEKRNTPVLFFHFLHPRSVFICSIPSSQCICNLRKPHRHKDCILWRLHSLCLEIRKELRALGFPNSSVGKEPACNAGERYSIPGSGRSPGEGVGFPLQYYWASLVARLVKNVPAMWETWIQSLVWENRLKKGKATHSSILAWRIPWTVQSMGLQRVDDWVTFTLRALFQIGWAGWSAELRICRWLEGGHQTCRGWGPRREEVHPGKEGAENRFCYLAFLLHVELDHDRCPTESVLSLSRATGGLK